MAEDFDLFIRRLLHEVRNTLQQMTVGVNKVKLHDHQKEHTESVKLIQGAIVNVDQLLSRFHDLVRIKSYESHKSQVDLIHSILTSIAKRSVQFVYDDKLVGNTLLSDEILLRKFFSYLAVFLSDESVIELTMENKIAVLTIKNDTKFSENLLYYFSNEDKILNSEDLGVVELLAYINLILIIKKEAWQVKRGFSNLLIEMGLYNEN